MMSVLERPHRVCGGGLQGDRKEEMRERLALLSERQRLRFFAAVGEMLFASLPVSMRCGHAHPRNTIRDNDAEHKGSTFTAAEVDPYLADIVICALRMANTCPGRMIDLESIVVQRIETKNNVKL